MTLRLTFLGTSGSVPTTARNPSAIFCNREGEQLLFDVGEGTQRQMMRYGTGFSVSDIFITHLHGDHVLGLPGLIQTWNFNDRKAPLTIHVPSGIESQVKELVYAVQTTPSYPCHVRGLTPGEIAISRDDVSIRAIEVDHRTTAVGYVLEEAKRKGRFDRERAEELGVPVGPKFSTLHEGAPVELEDGTVIEPEQVVGPPRPGRTIVYTGDTRPVGSVIEAARGANVLIHDATFASDRAERAAETGHSTAAEAANVAAEANVDRLLLTHISSRYAGDSSPLIAEARSIFDGEVTIAHDGLEVSVQLPE